MSRLVSVLQSGTRSLATGTRPSSAPSAGRAAGSSTGKRAELDARRVLCVASCKGGVGKSSVALNVAASLALQGQRVGVLDLDIFGPSLPVFAPPPADFRGVFGTAAGRIVPLEWGAELGFPHPLQLMSYGYLKPGDYAAVRGPIIAGIAQQMVTSVDWRGLDTLVIDMPPGTGDVHLTLSQQIDVDGALMVTTPQQLALVDVEKGIRMFDAVCIPTIAVVENMSFFQCGGCGARHTPFGEGGGRLLAERFGISSFHQLPLDAEFSRASGGEIASSDMRQRPIARAFDTLATALNLELDVIAASRSLQPRATKGEGGFTLDLWEGDTVRARIPSRRARLSCRCAKCVDEWTGKPLLDPAKVPEDIVALKVESAGRYAVHVHYSDFHSSIHTLAQLRELG